MTDDPNEQVQEIIETAAAGPAFEFLGKRLHPFSFDRNACWQRCGYEDIESIFEASVAIVFFCTLNDWDAIDLCRGDERIRGMRKRLGEWADQNEINGNSDNGREANRIGNEIWIQLKVSRFKAEGTATAAPNV